MSSSWTPMASCGSRRCGGSSARRASGLVWAGERRIGVRGANLGCIGDVAPAAVEDGLRRRWHTGLAARRVAGCTRRDGRSSRRDVVRARCSARRMWRVRSRARHRRGERVRPRRPSRAHRRATPSLRPRARAQPALSRTRSRKTAPRAATRRARPRAAREPRSRRRRAVHDHPRRAHASGETMFTMA